MRKELREWFTTDLSMCVELLLTTIFSGFIRIFGPKRERLFRNSLMGLNLEVNCWRRCTCSHPFVCTSWKWNPFVLISWKMKFSFYLQWRFLYSTKSPIIHEKNSNSTKRNWNNKLDKVWIASSSETGKSKPEYACP